MAYDPRIAAPHPLTDADRALAGAVAPVIRFADNEPFLPSKVGITVLNEPGQSPSAELQITFGPGVARVIEYAIWWDWDIQHLYELEHVWVKLGAEDQVLGVAASAHGGLFDMVRPNGSLPLENGRVTLYAEPGKHAFHATPESILARRKWLEACCGPLTAEGRVLINAMFATDFAGVTPEDHRAVRRHLQQRAFLPAFRFGQTFDVAALDGLSWPELHDYIAARVPDVLAEVRASQPLLKAVLLDSGDTLVDEATEIRDAEGYVIEASLIPGAIDMVERLAAEGYRLVLVADGRLRSFETILGRHGVRPHLEAEIISEVLNCEKPDRRMFDAAFAALALQPADAGQVVMIGNHLARDVKGANQCGIISIWQNWSPRREKQAATLDEVPDYVVRSPGEIPALLERIELDLAHQAVVNRVAGNEGDSAKYKTAQHQHQ
ncbi:MAG: HAD family hydrolase [Devosia sp.]|nr:HAD family hydrolase [Devosia sp.]